MFKRAISIVLILVLVPNFTGCVSVRAFNLTGVERPGSEGIYAVITVGGQQVDFDEPSTDVRNDSIYATVNQTPYAIALDQVQQLEVPEEVMPIVVIFAAFAVIMLIGLGLGLRGF